MIGWPNYPTLHPTKHLRLRSAKNSVVILRWVVCAKGHATSSTAFSRNNATSKSPWYPVPNSKPRQGIPTPVLIIQPRPVLQNVNAQKEMFSKTTLFPQPYDRLFRRLERVDSLHRKRLLMRRDRTAGQVQVLRLSRHFKMAREGEKNIRKKKS